MPVYKNPPIQEAVCEFTFVPLAGDPEWDLTLPGKLQLDKELAEYSEKSRQQFVHEINAGDDKGKPDVSLKQTLFRILLPNKDGTALLSVGHNAFGVVVLKPYEGWEKFQPRVMRALKVYMAQTGLKKVKRVGIRYINRIVAPEAGASNGPAYLSELPISVEAAKVDKKGKVVGRLTAVNSRHEFVTEDGTKFFVTQATLNPEKKNTTEYLLDIDTVYDGEPIDGADKITPVLEKLHDIEGAVFERFITEAARTLFNA